MINRRWAVNRSPNCHKRRKERGAVAVEAALITPLLFFLIFMIIETGPLFLLWSSNKHAAQEGARMATVAGTTNDADYNILKAMRPPLSAVGNRLKYVIVYRATDLYSKAPQECLTEADDALALSVPANQAVGYFRTDTGTVMRTGDPQTALTTFDWTAKRPAVACNVYRFDQLGIPNTRFQYDSAAPPADLSLDRFWPATKRNDSIAARQDYVGIYVRSSYTSMTGVISSRTVNHTYVGVIEALKVQG